jgi:uncharacterized protein (DUF305 family)
MTTHEKLMPRLRRAPLFAVLGVVALAAVACGNTGTDTGSSATGPSSTAPAEAGHNQADVEFLQGMIPHHEQAVVMSNLALERSQNPRVLALAEQIKAAQQPEIDQMNGLLAGWGVEAPGGGHEGGHGSGGAHPGMLSDDELAQLQAAGGTEFDRRFLEGMIDHHRGAVTVSQAQLAEGQAPEAKELAQAIIDAQEAEIAEMERILTEL